MKFTISVKADGLERKFSLLVARARDLDKPLREFDRILAAKVRDRFKAGGPGWPGLAQATLQERRSRAMAALESRLRRDVRRQSKKHARRFGALEALGLGGYERQRRTSAAALQRRVLTLEEFRRQKSGGEGEALVGERQLASLAARTNRAEQRASERVLGRIAGSFKSTIRNGTLVRESEIPWAGVHNEGGTAGHGAVIPARPFLYLEAEDVEALVQILRRHFGSAFEE